MFPDLLARCLGWRRSYDLTAGLLCQAEYGKQYDDKHKTPAHHFSVTQHWGYQFFQAAIYDHSFKSEVKVVTCDK